MERKSIILFGLLTLIASGQALASQKTICGTTDDREPSQNPKVARVLKAADPAGCTLTMIGRVCAISAGHCISTFEMAEFNTPPSAGGRIQRPAADDVYQVDTQSIVYRNGGQGDDFAVLRLKAQVNTGAYAGDRQGFYGVSFDAPVRGDIVRITGYGADRAEPTRNFAQQTHLGDIFEISGTVMRHRADTMGGNSGSSIILESSDEIVAIHTHGGCYENGGANASTLISAHQQLKQAITDCLQWEQDNL